MTPAPPTTESISPGELIELCAQDSGLYCQTFFPLTFRQLTPTMHADIWNLLEDRQQNRVALEVFRGGAKTTTLRVYISKRIAYGTSRTILLVGVSQGGAEKSLRWIKGQVEHNRLWTSVYGLAKGSKWTDGEIEIYSNILNINITVIAVGITGQIRGLNVDDWRPDLIVADDPVDDENAATFEQRKKLSDLFFGALEKSLTAATECPDAKMVLLQTSLHREDLVNQCHLDPQWASRRYGCFDEEGHSRWPARFPTETLLKAKEGHIARNQLAVWMREMECSIVSDELCYFRPEWLQYYDVLPGEMLGKMMVYLAIDPVPPPSERELAVGLRRKDYETICAIGVLGHKRYLLGLERSRGHDPSWTISTFFSFIDRFRPIKARVEAVGYQRTLKWVLEQEMIKRHHWIQVNAVNDHRAKEVRIRQSFSEIASSGQFFVRPDFFHFIDQFRTYPNVVHDDDLDVVSMALDEARGVYVSEDANSDSAEENGEEVPVLAGWRRAP